MIFRAIALSFFLGLMPAIFLPTSGHASQNVERVETQVGWNFDWDDNIMYTPTKIVLFRKNGSEELLMDTAAFAVHRKSIGQEGTYNGVSLADYEILSTEEKNSFRYFRDGKSGENYFLQDVRAALQTDPAKWKGPSWDAFLFALNRESFARRTTIITARGHSRKAMMEALEYLKQQGWIRFLPPAENLFAVSHPDIAKEFSVRGSVANPSAIKAEVMKRILDDLQAEPVSPQIPLSLDRDGNRLVRQHLWGFSDDDFGNFDKARKVLSEEVKKGRWPGVKLVLFYTGIQDPARPQEVAVLTSQGTTRPRLSEEAQEGFVEGIITSCPTP